MIVGHGGGGGGGTGGGGGRASLVSMGQATSKNSETASGMMSTADTTTNKRVILCNNILFGCSQNVLLSLWWKSLIIICTMLLLFGSPVQFLIVSKNADFLFDVLYSIAFVVFVVDMIFHIITELEYFPLSFKRSNGTFLSCCTCGIGSFAFWCDVISTLSIIHDISFIHTKQFETPTMEIKLSNDGYPSNYGLVVNNPIPVEVRINLLVVVAKTVRVSRLIKSATVVKLASRMNMYWYVERCDPNWYFQRWLLKREKKRKAAEEEAKNSKSSSDIVRRASWGGLEIAALAAIKAKASEERARKKNSFFGNLQVRVKRLFALSPKNKHAELRRHIAATRIQRAWRNTLLQPNFATMSDDGLGIGGMSTTGDDVGQSTQGWNTGRSTNAFSKHRNNPLLRNSAGESPSRISGGKADGKNIAGSHRESRGEVRPQSQVGSAMGELTGHRVASGIMITLVLTILFTYQEEDATKAATMVMLHGQTIDLSSQDTAYQAVSAARGSSISDLFQFNTKYNSAAFGPAKLQFPVDDFGVRDIESLRSREKLKILVSDNRGTSEGLFVYRRERVLEAIVQIAATIFILLVWFLGVNAFAGPVMTLVIIPIERMVRLLGMLMLDPLGYQSTSRFKKFLLEEDVLVNKTQWTKEVLKGMETSFLMSTILRIGSLMKVGFGSAGVEIIRNNLRGQKQNQLILNSQGSTVACIFLFCDIRQFTDATECLQEEVFVFTNRIAAVVHSICHSYGGSANKNVGDAFLVSWLLNDEESHARFGGFGPPKTLQSLAAKNHQADKAMLSVVRICMALHYNDFYVSTMSDTARGALLEKLKNRPGPVVQMGFGLHAGKAVQGAIGSQRKIDATYVSEAVETSEFLESSTKQYGLKMLMSDTFHRLLHHSNRRRCRKIDQLLIQGEDDDEEDEEGVQGDLMELYTFDMDIDALWRGTGKKSGGDSSLGDNGSDCESTTERSSIRKNRNELGGSSRLSGKLSKRGRRLSVRRFDDIKSMNLSDEMKSTSNMNTSFHDIISSAADAFGENSSAHFSHDGTQEAVQREPDNLVLPTGPSLYNANVWLQDDMRRIRHRYTNAMFQKFNSGLQAYYSKDWETAKQCFDSVLDRFQDGPTKYFVSQMEKYDGVPPRDFQPYGKA